MTEKHSASEKLQQQHFDEIASEYEKHYGDIYSQAYRHRFLNEPMLGDILLQDKKVADMMCGSGETTGYLLQRGAKVTGIDISKREIESFSEKWPTCDVRCASVLSTGLPDEAFDCVLVVMGLHHLHPHCSEAISEIHRILKPGGFFCFVEPHRGSILDSIRNFWYKRDKLFAANEESIDLEEMKQEFAGKFSLVKEEYKGNFAYIFVLNSLVLRMPWGFKKIYSKPLLWLESVIQKIQGKKTSCCVVCQWQKKENEA